MFFEHHFSLTLQIWFLILPNAPALLLHVCAPHHANVGFCALPQTNNSLQEFCFVHANLCTAATFSAQPPPWPKQFSAVRVVHHGLVVVVVVVVLVCLTRERGCVRGQTMSAPGNSQKVLNFLIFFDANQ